MESRYRHVNEDPLGFTKQTATMLVGLGAEDLIPQFKRRNISSQALTALGKQDLIVLGADEDLADDMLRELRAAARKNRCDDLSEELRTKQLIKIVTYANQQLNLIETFVSYARLRLAKDPTDFVIDFRKKLRASQALCAAVGCTIVDVENLEKNVRDLLFEFSDEKSDVKASKSRLMRFFTGIGITVVAVYALKLGIVSVRKT